MSELVVETQDEANVLIKVLVDVKASLEDSRSRKVEKGLGPGFSCDPTPNAHAMQLHMPPSQVLGFSIVAAAGVAIYRFSIGVVDTAEELAFEGVMVLRKCLGRRERE